jgi:hypothetical protein
MKRKMFAFLLAVMPLVEGIANAELMLNPLTSFGTNGFLASSAPFLGTSNNTRGLAYNGTTDRLYIPNRNAVPTSPNVQILDGSTGSAPIIGPTSLDMSGVAGGTFSANMLDLADDGTVYMANLSTSTATNDSNVFKIYRWAPGSEASAPTIAFSNPITGILANRLGDSFAVTGSGAGTRIVANGGTASNQTVLFTTADGTNFTTTGPSTVTSAPNGSIRFGVDFVDSTTVVAKGGVASFSLFNSTDGSGLTALTSTNSTILTAEGPMAFYAPLNLLASIEASTASGGSATVGNLVRLYQYDPTVVGGNRLTLLSSMNLTGTGPGSTPGGNTIQNGNIAGDLTFGVGELGDLRLYAMSTNNGIQAFTISAVPEPSSIALVTLGVVGVVARRRQLAGRKLVS